ncbi:MAG: RNA polymerase sigma factor [Acidobacteria bacterium]|nr:RNA polymerase sigma factor [Acidobacteriota bacterium]
MVNASAVPVEVDDAALVERVREGDREAFNELVERHASKIFRLARHITKNDAEASDVLQDAFLKAYSRLDQFQGDSKFYTWLVRIAVNEALMRLRKRRGDKTVSLDQDVETEDGAMRREVADEGEDPEEAYGREEMRVILERAIDSLSDTYRSVFVLRDVEGLSTEETADMLDLSISAVKSRLLRARLQLRDKLSRRLHNDGTDAESYL